MKSRDFYGVGTIGPNRRSVIRRGSFLLLACCFCAILPACSTDPTAKAPPEGIDLSGVAAWNHLDTDLRASVVAASAHFPEGLAVTRLQGARIHLVHSGLTFQAAQATIDLETLEGEGEGAVILEGKGFTATGGRFQIAAKAQELEISSPVRVEVPGA